MMKKGMIDIGVFVNKCKRCNGTSFIPYKNSNRRCPTCHGKGYILTELGEELVIVYKVFLSNNDDTIENGK